MAKSKDASFKIIVLITVVVAVLLVAVVMINNSNTGSTEGTAFDEQPSIEGQPVLGDPDAPVTVVEFGDFKCPSCKAWSELIYPQFVSDYVETGKVKLAYVNVLFHGEESKLGSLAGEYVYEQHGDLFWDFQKRLYEEQPSTSHDSEWITEEKLVEVAQDVSSEIDTEEMLQAIEKNTHIDEINRDTELVTTYDVQLTPTIMIDEIMLEDPFDYDALQEVIDSKLEGK